MSATALPSDRAEHRAWLASLVAVPAGGVVVDLGCGSGEDLRLLAASHPDAAARFVGIDGAAKSVATAVESMRGDQRVTLRCAPLDGVLPLDDASVDVAYSHNLLECLPRPDAFAREVARVLRPGGQVVVAHWDWDTQCWDGDDRALVRRLVAAWADWQQAWMAQADGWMGRRLHGIFNATGLFEGEARARVLVNTRWEEGAFGRENALAMGALARRGLASADDVARFLAMQEALAAEGRWFYCLTGFAYVGRRRAA